MIAKHPCVLTFLNGVLHASKSFGLSHVCSGSWTVHMSFTIWSQRVPRHPIEIYNRHWARSWGEVG